MRAWAPMPSPRAYADAAPAGGEFSVQSWPLGGTPPPRARSNTRLHGLGTASADAALPPAPPTGWPAARRSIPATVLDELCVGGEGPRGAAAAAKQEPRRSAPHAKGCKGGCAPGLRAACGPNTVFAVSDPRQGNVRARTVAVAALLALPPPSSPMQRGAAARAAPCARRATRAALSTRHLSLLRARAARSRALRCSYAAPHAAHCDVSACSLLTRRRCHATGAALGLRDSNCHILHCAAHAV